jgi:hypothetical protein
LKHGFEESPIHERHLLLLMGSAPTFGMNGAIKSDLFQQRCQAASEPCSDRANTLGRRRLVGRILTTKEFRL